MGWSWQRLGADRLGSDRRGVAARERFGIFRTEQARHRADRTGMAAMDRHRRDCTRLDRIGLEWTGIAVKVRWGSVRLGTERQRSEPQERARSTEH